MHSGLIFGRYSDACLKSKATIFFLCKSLFTLASVGYNVIRFERNNKYYESEQ